MRTALYRHFNAKGELLYVGISLSALKRLGEHAANAKWYRSIANVTIEWHPTREAADAAETEAIRRECPKYNIAKVPAAAKPPRKEKNQFASVELTPEEFERIRLSEQRLGDGATLDSRQCAGLGGQSVSNWLFVVRAGEAPAPVVRTRGAVRWRTVDVRSYWNRASAGIEALYRGNLLTT
jgi:predicted GIY-YIG superfamily endonuclease